MKKKLIFAVFVGAIVLLSGITVFAAPQILVNDTNFNLKSNQAKHYTALPANYNNALVELTIDSVTSGTAKNVFVVYRLVGSKHTLQQKKTLGLTKATCIRYNLGYVGYGTWLYSVFAGDLQQGTAYAGWSGTNKLESR